MAIFLSKSVGTFCSLLPIVSIWKPFLVSTQWATKLGVYNALQAMPWLWSNYPSRTRFIGRILFLFFVDIFMLCNSKINKNHSINKIPIKVFIKNTKSYNIIRFKVKQTNKAKFQDVKWPFSLWSSRPLQLSLWMWLPRIYYLFHHNLLHNHSSHSLFDSSTLFVISMKTDHCMW